MNIAQAIPPGAIPPEGIFGDIKSPYSGTYPSGVGGIIIFFTNLIRLAFLVAGLFVMVKIVLAGFAYITAGGEPKKLEQAWANIWQSLVGLLIMVSAFALSALIGQLFFGDAFFILHPMLYGVGTGN
jgi:hypothetical protein